MSDLVVRGARLHVEDVGSGPALLLLHGIGSNSRSFRRQLDALRETHRVLAWDAPGYGRSDDPLTPFSLEDLADAAVGVLDQLGIAQSHVLGHSMGGLIAQLVYHRHAERVLSLILSDTSAGTGSMTDAQRQQRLRDRLDAIDHLTPRELAQQRAASLLSQDAGAEVLVEVTDIMAEVRPPGYRAAAVAMSQTDLTDRLASIRVPTLVIHGEHDAVIPLSTGRGLAEAIPNARLVVIPNAGHASNQQQPELFNAAVHNFLQNLQRHQP